MSVVMACYRATDGMRRRKRRTLGRSWVQLEVLTRHATFVMAGKLHSGWAGWEVIFDLVRHRRYPVGWSYEELKMPKRRGRKGSDLAAAVSASPETEVLVGYPHLVEHLVSREWDDKTPRQPGMIMIMTQGSMWRMIAKEPDEGMQMVVYAASVDAALQDMELMLGTDDAPWEPDPYAKRKPAPKSKK